MSLLNFAKNIFYSINTNAIRVLLNMCGRTVQTVEYCSSLLDSFVVGRAEAGVPDDRERHVFSVFYCH